MVKTCPICAGKQFKPWNRVQSLDLWRCQQCSLVFLEAAQRPDDYFDQVETEFFSDGYLRRRGLFADRFLVHKARRRMQVIQRFKPSGSLLDIGCGTGELIHVARQMGYQAAGLDYSESLARYVSEKYGVEVYLGSPETVRLPYRVDIAVMSHMLEHTTDPIATLRHVRRLLNPGGLIYLAVPNLDCWESRFRGWASYEPYHLWYFNPDNLRHLLERVGYQVVSIHTWEPYAAWLNTVIRTMVPQQHAQVRAVVHRDHSQRSRYLFLGAMGFLNAARFVSGLLLTPIRLIQERVHKGEELIFIAVKDHKGSQEKAKI